METEKIILLTPLLKLIAVPDSQERETALHLHMSKVLLVPWSWIQVERHPLQLPCKEASRQKAGGNLMWLLTNGL